jgi:tetratricopeptide (TPR) repeat protein
MLSGMKPRCIAILVVVSVASLLGDDYEDLFRQAAALSEQGKYDQAIAKYESALGLRPNAPEALNNLAVMYYETHRYADAFQTASKVWPHHPEMSSAALIAGLSAIQNNEPDRAIDPLNAVLRANPNNRDAILALASASLARNEPERAVEFYNRQLGQAPADPDAWYGLAISYERMAEAASKKLSEIPGGAGYSKRLLGEFLLSRGDSRLAQEAFGESIAAGPGSREAAKQYDLAAALAAKARNAFEKFVSIAPDSWQADLFMGDLDRQHRKFPSALAHYQAALKKQSSAAALVGIGTVYWEMGDFPNAERYLQDALRLNPQSNQAIFELANIAVRQHREEAAIPLLERYLAAQPDALAARADLGRAYLHTGRFREAAEQLSKASDADERGDIHYELATALRKLGREDEAKAALAKSAAIREAALQREQRIVAPQH